VADVGDELLLRPPRVLGHLVHRLQPVGQPGQLPVRLHQVLLGLPELDALVARLLQPFLRLVEAVDGPLGDGVQRAHRSPSQRAGDEAADDDARRVAGRERRACVAQAEPPDHSHDANLCDRCRGPAERHRGQQREERVEEGQHRLPELDDGEPEQGRERNLPDDHGQQQLPVQQPQHDDACQRGQHEDRDRGHVEVRGRLDPHQRQRHGEQAQRRDDQRARGGAQQFLRRPGELRVGLFEGRR